MLRVNKKPWLGMGDMVRGNDLLFAPKNVEQRSAVLLTLLTDIFWLLMAQRKPCKKNCLKSHGLFEVHYLRTSFFHQIQSSQWMKTAVTEEIRAPSHTLGLRFLGHSGSHQQNLGNLLLPLHPITLTTVCSVGLLQRRGPELNFISHHWLKFQ